MQDAREVNRLEKQRLNKEVRTALSYCPEMTMALIVVFLPLGTFLVFSDVDIMQKYRWRPHCLALIHITQSRASKVSLKHF